MTKTIYVVSERSFEYNDEIYHLPYDGSGENSGKAKLAFTNKDKALSIRDSKNIEWLKNLDNEYGGLGAYTQEGLNGITNRGDSNRLENLFNDLKISYEDYDIIIPKDISDENAFEIIKLLDIAPWIVSEVIFEE